MSNAVEERLMLLRQLLADEKALPHPDERYIADLKVSIERAEARVDKMKLWHAA